jgi:hypothetical protein
MIETGSERIYYVNEKPVKPVGKFIPKVIVLAKALNKILRSNQFKNLKNKNHGNN